MLLPAKLQWLWRAVRRAGGGCAAAIVAQLHVPSRAIQTTCTRLPWLGDQCCLGVAAFGLAERALHGRATLGHLSSHDQLIIWLG